jgi:hypothetical protein
VGRKIFSVVILAAALLAAAGCGGSGDDASVGADANRDKSVTPAANADAPGLQTVAFQGVEFDVPAGWAVHDLSSDPSQCVRFDVNAVYLGHPGPDMQCPAGLVGHADAVLVEPTDGAAENAISHGNDVSAAASAHGLEMRVAHDNAANEVDADVPSAGVSVTLTYQDSDSTAQQILESLRTAGS